MFISNYDNPTKKTQTNLQDQFKITKILKDKIKKKWIKNQYAVTQF
jgi:hypothetical protein